MTGKIAHYFNLQHHDSTFVEELIMLVQFELGTLIPLGIRKIFGGKRAKIFKATHEIALKAKAQLLKERPDATPAEQLAVMMMAYRQFREGISKNAFSSSESLINDLRAEVGVVRIYQEFIKKGVTTTAETNTEVNIQLRKEREKKTKKAKSKECSTIERGERSKKRNIK